MLHIVQAYIKKNHLSQAVYSLMTLLFISTFDSIKGPIFISVEMPEDSQSAEPEWQTQGSPAKKFPLALLIKNL